MLTLLRFLRNLPKGDLPCLALFVLLNLFFFGNILFTQSTLFYRDIGGYHHPLKKLVTEAYANGQWPLWNPYIQFGQPLLGNPNAMAVYPTQLLFHLLPFEWAFDLNLVLHCLIGGIGAFYLARRLGFSRAGALAAGIAYNFSGVMLSFVNLPLLAAIAGVLPWLAFFLVEVVQKPRVVTVAALSLVIGLLFLVLEPLTCAAALLFLLPLGAYAWVTRAAGVSGRIVALALLVALVSGFCLSALQVFPTLEMLEASGRHAGLDFSKAAFWSVHPLSLTQMLFPAVWQDHFDLRSAHTYWSSVFFEGREAYIVSCYCGLSCLLLAVLGLFFSEKVALKWMLAAVTCAALVLALGRYTPVYRFLYDFAAPFRFGRYPAKYLLAAALSTALLAGLGIDALMSIRIQIHTSKVKRRLAAYLLIVSALLTGSAFLTTTRFWEKFGGHVADNAIRLHFGGAPLIISLPVLRDSVVYLSLVVLAGVTLVLLSAFVPRVRPTWIVALAAVLVFVDLLTNRSINPLVSVNAYDQSPVSQWLLDRSHQGGPCRVYYWTPGQVSYLILGKTDSLVWSFLFRKLATLPYTAAGDHVEYSSFPPVDRLESRPSQLIDLELKQTNDLGDKLSLLARSNTGYILSMDEIHSPLLERQASFSLNSDRPLLVYRLRNALPRAYLVDARQSTEVMAPANISDTSLTRHEAGRVDLRVSATKPSMLVLLDSYYPGWRVWVDGRERQVEVVNRAFRGVIIQPGKHQVAFRYDPESFRYGAALTVSTMAAWVAALIFLYFRRKAAGKKRLAAVLETEQVR